MNINVTYVRLIENILENTIDDSNVNIYNNNT